VNDCELVEIVDGALAEATRKAGAWLACRPGCCACCRGPFPISLRDAVRLRQGLTKLDASDPRRAGRLRRRAAAYQGGDDEACPALDPDLGICELYEARPLTCRTFGPAIRFGDGDIGVCELCFTGASEEQIAACAVELDSALLEEEPITVAEAITRLEAGPNGQ
jgi:Fe-S-cluster containining protein